MEPGHSTVLVSGRYRLERLLGEGASKRAHLARDTRLERDVVLAFLKTEGLDRDGMDRLRAEARDMARLGPHPNLVTVYDLGEHEGALFVSAEYVAGGTLRERLDAAPGRRLDPAFVVRVAVDVCRALAHAHAAGVVHRDLNPANVWLTTSGDAKVGDFGLAVSLVRSRAVREGQLVTAFAYMPPELALGRPADPRGDLYSLGAVLYELATGRPPFLGDDALAVLAQHLHTPPVPPSSYAPDIPAALEHLVLRLLAKVPEDRPRSAEEVAAVLATVGGGAASVLPPLERLAGGLFVGREPVMAALRGAFEDALAGRRTTVLLAGDPGIGKTRTAEQLATYARLRGARVLLGRCWEHAGAPAYWPWTQVVRTLLADPAHVPGARDAADLARIGGERLDDLSEDAARDSPRARFELFDAFARVLRRVSSETPLVVVLDDVHGADQASVLLLRHLAREVPDARLLLVATYRDVELAPADPLSACLADVARDARSIRLGGLDDAAVGRLIELATGRAAPPAVVAAVHERTGGNPLFVVEIVRLAASDGTLDRIAAGAWRVPDSVRAVIRQRLGHVDEQTSQVLARAAVTGREFDLDVVEHVLGDAAAVRDAIDAARGARLVEAVPGSPGRVRFSHVLVRDALYDAIGTTERSMLHRRVADAIATLRVGDLEPHAATLAHHHLQAGALDHAVAYATRAAERAAAQLAHEDAVELYAFAVRALERLPDAGLRRCELLVALGRERWRAGQTVAAREAFGAAAADARALGAAEVLAKAAVGFAGRTGITLGVNHDAVRLLEEALAALRDRAPALRAEAQARLATELYFADGAAERREALSRDAVALATAHGDEALLAYVLSARHFVRWQPGTLAERLALADRMCALGERAGAKEVLRFGRTWRVVDLLESGDVRAVDGAIAEFARLAAELREPYCDWLLAAFRAMRALVDGRFAEAETLATDALAQGERAGEGISARMVYGVQLYLSRREQGRLGELEALIGGFAEAHPELHGMRAGVANLLAEVGRVDEARLCFDRLAAAEFEDVPATNDWLVTMATHARTCVRLGDAPRARLLYDRLLPYADSTVVVSYGIGWDGAVAHYLGMLATLRADFAGAERHFEAAELLHRRAGARVLLADTRRERARLLLRRRAAGDRAEAVRMLREVAQSYEALGLAARVAEVRQLAAGEAPAVPPAEPARPNTFVREGAGWCITYGGVLVRLDDLRGLRYVARLLETPEREVHVVELVGLVDGDGPAEERGRPGRGELPVRGGEGEDLVLDARARGEYRRRLEDLGEEIADAGRAHDLGRLERARAERATIEEALAAAFGATGRGRRRGHPVERARKAVYNRIRSAVAAIDERHADLGRHLARSLTTGTYCVYRPERPTSWRFA